MGRYAGPRSALNKQRKKIAERKGISPRRVTLRRAASNLGIREIDEWAIRPGFEIYVKPPVFDRSAAWSNRGQRTFTQRPAETVEKALGRMKHWDPKTEQPSRKRKGKNKPRKTSHGFF